ncbi:MAG: hypothetical protein V1787_04975 [Candidatus Micrarchaeota archaeon]
MVRARTLAETISTERQRGLLVGHGRRRDAALNAFYTNLEAAGVRGDRHPYDFFGRTRPTRADLHDYAESFGLTRARYPPLWWRKEYRKIEEYPAEAWAAYKAGQVVEILQHRDLSRDRRRENESPGEKSQREGRWKGIENEIKEGIKGWARSGKSDALTLRVFWGGAKDAAGGSRLNDSERHTMERLHRLALQVREIGVPMKIDILFADLHARYINNAKARSIAGYRRDVRREAGRRGFGFSSMLKMWRAHNPLVKDTGEAYRKALENEQTARDTGLDKLGEERSAKHDRSVIAGEISARQSTGKYTAVRSFEQPMLDSYRETGTLYLDFGEPSEAAHYPQNTLFAWAHGRGKATKPWVDGKTEYRLDGGLARLGTDAGYGGGIADPRKLHSAKVMALGSPLLPDIVRIQGIARRLRRAGLGAAALTLVIGGVLGGWKGGGKAEQAAQPPEVREVVRLMTVENAPTDVKWAISRAMSELPKEVTARELSMEIKRLKNAGVPQERAWMWGLLRRSGMDQRLSDVSWSWKTFNDRIKEGHPDSTLTDGQVAAIDKIIASARGASDPNMDLSAKDRFIYNLWKFDDVLNSFSLYNPNASREKNVEAINNVFDVLTAHETRGSMGMDNIGRFVHSDKKSLLEDFMKPENYDRLKRLGVFAKFRGYALEAGGRPMLGSLIEQLRTSHDEEWMAEGIKINDKGREELKRLGKLVSQAVRLAEERGETRPPRIDQRELEREARKLAAAGVSRENAGIWAQLSLLGADERIEEVKWNLSGKAAEHPGLTPREYALLDDVLSKEVDVGGPSKNVLSMTEKIRLFEEKIVPSFRRYQSWLKPEDQHRRLEDALGFVQAELEASSSPRAASRAQAAQELLGRLMEHSKEFGEFGTFDKLRAIAIHQEGRLFGGIIKQVREGAGRATAQLQAKTGWQQHSEALRDTTNARLAKRLGIGRGARRA